jgi:hypothetical protein
MSSEACSFDFDLDLSFMRTPSVLRSPDLPCRFTSLTAGSSETAGAELPLFSAHGSAGFSARWIAVLCVELPGLLSVVVFAVFATSLAESAAQISGVGCSGPSPVRLIGPVFIARMEDVLAGGVAPETAR